MFAMFHLRKESRPRSHRPSCIPTDGERFNERLFVDLCDVVDVRLVAVDQHTDYTVIAPCPSHEQLPRRFSNTGFGGQDPLTYWCATESEAWELSVRNTGANNSCMGRVEQRIATVKEVAGKTILQHQVLGRSVMSVVSCEVAPRAEPKSREVGHPPSYTSF